MVPVAAPSPARLTFASLYSGAGGLDLGFARAGFTPVFANDVDPNAVATYNGLSSVRDPEWRDAAGRFEGHAAVCGDAGDATSGLGEGAADVVIGGPPCQGFSVAGRMDPNDPRSRHVFDFLDVVARVRPRAFVMENVAALARNRRWSEVREALLERATMLGFRVDLLVLDASQWGVPQARERMFLVGTPLSGPGCVLPAPPTRDAPVTVREALSVLPRAGEHGNGSLCPAAITPARSPVLRRSPYAGMLFNGQGRPVAADRPAPTLPASMGGNRTPIVDEGDLYEGAEPWVVGYHRQLVAGGAPLRELPSGARLRRLTVEEAAALQSFPVDMPWRGSQSARFRQIGNAVPPLLAFAVARAVAAALR